jgi:hypothetical protein
MVQKDYSPPVTKISGITLSTQNLDLPSEPTSVQSDGMASINKCYESERFSEEARKLLSASWPKLPDGDSKSKISRFVNCVPMQINLSKADPRFEKDSELPDYSKTILLVVFLSD